jgi:RNA polymerase sigma-70 factor, ECF subfamily
MSTSVPSQMHAVIRKIVHMASVQREPRSTALVSSTETLRFCVYRSHLHDVTLRRGAELSGGMEEAQGSKGEAFTRLLVANQGRIYAFIYTLVHNPDAASDVLQETSAILWRKFDAYDPSTDFGIWAMSVARLCVFEWRRKQSRLALPLNEQELTQIADEAVAVSCDYEQRRRALRQCLSKLGDNERNLLWTRYEQSRSVAEIAQTMQLTRMGVYKRLNKLHSALLTCIRTRLAAGDAV